MPDFKCECGHDLTYLQQEITAGRPIQRYVRNDGGDYILICDACGYLWDDRETDMLIKLIMARR
jgi:hypothetical protein